MKRTLIVMRHAKTEEQKEDQTDFERNLTERGKNNAQLMAERIADKGYKPDLILTSSANRTEQTTEIVLNAGKFTNVKKRSTKVLYHATADIIEDEIMSVEHEIKTLMIVGHNPGTSEFVFDCDPKSISASMPTSAIAIFTFEADNWQLFSTAKKNLDLYDYPKK